jgi:hypothetical protein
MLEDLKKSGLTAADLDARPLDDPERAMCLIPPAVQGYVLPYYDMDGRPLPFYRVRQFENLPRYKQVKDSQNYVYFPKGFKKALERSTKGYILITEGEKKAAKAVKEGFPCVALSGVDSWKTKTLVLPEGTELSAARVPGGRQGLVKARLPSSDDPKSSSTLAVGFQDLISLAIEQHLALIICYDSDEGGMKYEVQRAAASLAFELRFQGVPFSKIRQVVLLPTAKLKGGKIGLDDFLLHNGSSDLVHLCDDALRRRSAFPRHPNVRAYIAKKLQNPRLDRKTTQSIGLAILAEMDARGRRLRSASDDQLYYFDDLSRALIKVYMAGASREIINDTPFARFLYNEFGISSADIRLMQWFATQFASEEGVEYVRPFKVIAQLPNDSIAYQISDGQFAKVSCDGIDIQDNGTDGIMFESETVQPIDPADLLQAIERLGKQPLKMWWEEVLKDVRLKEDPYLRDTTALLYYLSPWLLRWRGTQLPIELVIGESGSGKSSLYEMRLQILMGYPALRNAPQDIKDWHASVAHSGGLHVTDNVQLVDKNLRQRLSDELCRIVTEPDPHIEMRKLYSNAELMRIPVSCCFAITAIQQPFLNADLIQRSVIIELDKSVHQKPKANGSGAYAEVTFDSRWVEHQLARFGTRVDWIAHHLLVLRKFFELAQKEWDSNYLAKNRLINLEQAMILMAKIFGKPYDWIAQDMSKSTEKAMSETDWALAGLVQFADMIREMGPNYDKQYFGAPEISQWATDSEEFSQCYQLTNPRSLGRYIQAHKQTIAQLTGIVEYNKVNNRMIYHVPKKISGDRKKSVANPSKM